MNVTTLLMPLYAVNKLACRLIPTGTAYVDTSYRQALALSTTYQGGLVLWASFWAIYGDDASLATLTEVARFGSVYMCVVLVDLAVLWLAKRLAVFTQGPLFNTRLHATAG
jgi:hypothetical protein